MMAGCGAGRTEHCWERIGATGSNKPDGTVVEIETERCRHCPAIRELQTVITITSSATDSDYVGGSTQHHNAVKGG